MAVSIFTKLQNWTSGVTYKKYDRVKYGNFTYYADRDHSNETSNPSLDFKNWKGVMRDPMGSILTETDAPDVPHFFFSPSYGATVSVEPKIGIIKFGDGYEQRIKKNLIDNLMKIDLSFDLRSSAEASAILHFINERGGVQAFLFIPPEPYSTLRSFVCRSWSHSIVFFDNHSIKASFEQVPY